jgi:hypothetical protein
MQIVDTTRQDWELVLPNTRGGDVFRKVIHGAEGGRQVSYDVRIERFGEGDRGYSSIRHRHDFEQLRFAVEGRMDLGFAVLETGDVAYFPANAYYGPQKCEGSVILIAQWGDRFITRADSDRAVAELSRNGEFRDGIYRAVTPDGRPFNKDPLNAIWEQVFQTPYVPQPPRYKQPVVMTPSAFGWGEPEGAIRRRRLGTFTENPLTVEMVEWLEDGPLHLASSEADNRPTLLFTTAGSFSHDGEEFGPHTGLWSETAATIELNARAGSEVLVVRFPVPSSRITLGLED